MLVIRDAQMQALQQGRRQVFLERLVAHLQTDCPAACAAVCAAVCAEAGAAALHSLTDRELRRGMAVGIRAERDLAVFVSVMLVAAATRDTPAWLAQVQKQLTDARVPLLAERVARLFSATLRRLDIEARNRRILQELGHANAG